MNDHVRSIMKKPLLGTAVAVLVESTFISEEIQAYCSGFTLLGAEVHLVSRLWGNDTLVFYSDVDPSADQPWETPRPLVVNKDIGSVQLSHYAALIMAANYTSVRLRWEGLPQQDPASIDARAYVQSSPAVRLFAEAMHDRHLVKGALCHGLWILTPYPDLLEGRKVTCHTVVMADVLNCGADIQFERNEQGEAIVAPVVRDGDLVTGYSKAEVLPFIEAVAAAVVERAAA